MKDYDELEGRLQAKEAECESLKLAIQMLQEDRDAREAEVHLYEDSSQPLNLDAMPQSAPREKAERKAAARKHHDAETRVAAIATPACVVLLLAAATFTYAFVRGIDSFLYALVGFTAMGIILYVIFVRYMAIKHSRYSKTDGFERLSDGELPDPVTQAQL